MKRLRLLPFAAILFLALASTACAGLRAINPFSSVSATDAEWSGVAGAPISVTGSVVASANSDPRTAAAISLLELGGLQDPLGVLLPVTAPGETSPRWVLCTAQWAAKCRAVPLNAKVDFAGAPIGPGILWRPSRLKF